MYRVSNDRLGFPNLVLSGTEGQGQPLGAGAK